MHNLKVRKFPQKLCSPPSSPQKNNGLSPIRSGLIFVFGGLIFLGGGVCIGVGAIIRRNSVFQNNCLITFGGDIVFETF